MIEYLEIGTPEHALRNCVKLFSRLFEVPEAEVRGYLDMYFQLRLRWEEEKGRIATPACAPVRNDRLAAAGGASPSPTEKNESDPSPAAPGIAKNPRPERKGNDYAAKAAAFKRETRERLLEMRKRGLTTPLIVKRGNANITEQQIADILAAKPVPVAVYRGLEAVLDMIEKDNVPSDASAEG